jgi:hypothetical protein
MDQNWKVLASSRLVYRLYYSDPDEFGFADGIFIDLGFQFTAFIHCFHHTALILFFLSTII